MSGDAVVRTVWLPCGVARAFALFTEEAGAWWPPERRHLDDPESAIVISVDGAFRERARDGREAALGAVRAWEAPHRLLLDFYVGTGPEAPTEVEITFTEERGGTRVTVEHRPGRGGERFRERAPRFASSWDAVLAALAGASAVGG